MSKLVTLEEARQWLRERITDGEKCPCCTQLAKVYKRKINSGMAAALINQWNHVGTDMAHTRDLWLPFSKEAAQLQWWGLVEQDQQLRDDGGASGRWRITGQGVRFIRKQLVVPKYARVYDGRNLGLFGDLVSITDSLGSKFNYSELMAGV